MQCARPLWIVVFLLLPTCKSEQEKQSDLYASAWKDFHASPPQHLSDVRSLLGEGQCETLPAGKPFPQQGVACTWSLMTTNGPKHITVSCEGTSSDPETRGIFFPDDKNDTIDPRLHR